MNFDITEILSDAMTYKVFYLALRVLLEIVIFVVGTQLIKIIRKIIRKSMEKAHADKGVTQFVDSFVKTALAILLVFLIATNLGIDAASIVALIGSAGVTIGLAIQGSLSNLAGGVLILLLKPFKVGDYIIENAGKQEGTVTEIEIFYTKLITYDNKIVYVPNGTLANNSIINLTALKIRRLDVFVEIAYDSDLRLAKTVLLDLLQKDEKSLKDKEICVFVDELAKSGVRLGVRCWVKCEDFWETKWRITEGCKTILESNNITIPFAQLDVHLKEK